jgi:hypothetical protein
VLNFSGLSTAKKEYGSPKDGSIVLAPGPWYKAVKPEFPQKLKSSELGKSLLMVKKCGIINS